MRIAQTFEVGWVVPYMVGYTALGGVAHPCDTRGRSTRSHAACVVRRAGSLRSSAAGLGAAPAADPN